MVQTYDGQWVVLLGTKKYMFTKLLNATTAGNVDDCFFNVEVKAGNINADFKVVYCSTNVISVKLPNIVYLLECTIAYYMQIFNTYIFII